MIITPLDKEWARRETKKLIRQGRLKPKPCEICGAPKADIQHLNYNNPRRVRWLCRGCRAQAHANGRLSALQQQLLKIGLMCYHRTPLDVALEAAFAGCFGLKGLMRKFEDRRERHRRRSAFGLSVARLIKRGLLESPVRGRWRLTLTGVKLASALYPEIKPLTKRQLKEQLAPTLALRTAIKKVLG